MLSTLQDNLYFKDLSSPLGPLRLTADHEHLVRLDFLSESQSFSNPGSNAVLDEVEKQLKAYFSGSLRVFDLPLAPAGTQFQRQVWQALTEIPYAQTWSYKDLATKVCKPKGFQAVGQANGRNPIAIIIPCHRVIAADGGLGGYAGGLARKRLLLDLEQQVMKKRAV